MFLLAHELFDALPIHQFKYLGASKWSEMCVKLESPEKSSSVDLSSPLLNQANSHAEDITEEDMHKRQLVFGETAPNTENVVRVLQPEKFFSDEAKRDLKEGDTIEVCPSAVDFTREIAQLVELTRGAALVVDYGEDHAFANSFRGIQNHKIIKDWPTIFNEVGRLDLTAYVNFKQIAQVALMNKKL